MFVDNWKEQFMSSKWLDIIKEVACKGIIDFTNVAELINIEKYLYESGLNGRVILVTYNWKL
jgi:hypothetical protein